MPLLFLLCINAQCATGHRHMPLPGVSWTGYIITNIVLLCKRIFFVIIIRGIINCAFLNECESVSSHPMPLVAMSADDAKKVPIHRPPDMTDNISIIIFPSDHGMASVWWSGHTFLSRNIGIVSLSFLFSSTSSILFLCVTARNSPLTSRFWNMAIVV